MGLFASAHALVKTSRWPVPLVATVGSWLSFARSTTELGRAESPPTPPPPSVALWAPAVSLFIPGRIEAAIAVAYQALQKDAEGASPVAYQLYMVALRSLASALQGRSLAIDDGSKPKPQPSPVASTLTEHSLSASAEPSWSTAEPKRTTCDPHADDAWWPLVIGLLNLTWLADLLRYLWLTLADARTKFWRPLDSFPLTIDAQHLAFLSPMLPDPWSTSETIIAFAEHLAIRLKQSPIPFVLTSLACLIGYLVQTVDQCLRLHQRVWVLSKRLATALVAWNKRYQIHQNVIRAITLLCTAVVRAVVAYRQAPPYKGTWSTNPSSTHE
ncbi:hypothetical protein H4R34_003708 [Dimargaris verticillata]|uniref:Uncharacterized protein n=1 Tax=Dimargaris verticillata TaxID=2761393 RepID=A0A9W8B074_9FUNG|nr:hypothetical protein H4R34_003708 [Dimargaris verticillata]